MSNTRFTLRSAVYLLLMRDKKVLLLRRFNTGWADGKYTLLAGHLDGNETVASSMAREAEEEAGITIDSKGLHVVHTMHHVSNVEYIDFFLVPNKWNGNPEIKEKNKCDDMQWFPLEDLPKNTLPHVKQAITAYLNHETFSEFKD